MDDFKKEVCKILLKSLFGGGEVFCEGRYGDLFELGHEVDCGVPKKLGVLIRPLNGVSYKSMPQGMKAQLIEWAIKPIEKCGLTAEEVDELLNPKAPSDAK